MEELQACVRKEPKSRYPKRLLPTNISLLFNNRPCSVGRVEYMYSTCIRWQDLVTDRQSSPPPKMHLVTGLKTMNKLATVATVESENLFTKNSLAQFSLDDPTADPHRDDGSEEARSARTASFELKVGNTPTIVPGDVFLASLRARMRLPLCFQIRHTLHLLLFSPCEHSPEPPQSLQYAFRLPCAHIDEPPQSLQRSLIRPCGQIPEPPQSLQRSLRRPCGH